METVPLCVCFSFGRISGGKYRDTGTSEEDLEAKSEKMDSPPVPVAVGSPACARKSFDTI